MMELMVLAIAGLTLRLLVEQLNCSFSHAQGNTYITKHSKSGQLCHSIEKKKKKDFTSVDDLLRQFNAEDV